MHSFSLGLLFVLCYVCAVMGAGLQVSTVFAPEECTLKTKPGDTVKIHYTGKLENGQVFDTSLQSGREPLEFEIGVGRVIPGMDQGLLDMCIGEQRKLVIPPELAYGDREMGPIPANSVLQFDTELVDIIPGNRPDAAADQTPSGKPKPASWLDGSSLGFLAIIVGFISIVYYAVTYKPEPALKERADKKTKKNLRKY